MDLVFDNLREVFDRFFYREVCGFVMIFVCMVDFCELGNRIFCCCVM
jgi:hypothetical protein